MGKKQKILFLFFLCVTLCGCQSRAPQAPRLVTRIQVSGVHQNTPIQAVYTQPQKMETLLYYLRSLEDLGKANTDPERIIGDHFKITVFYSDGTFRIYRQQADRFLSQDSKPWRTVDPKKASLLYPLLISMPPDQSSGAA